MCTSSRADSGKKVDTWRMFLALRRSAVSASRSDSIPICAIPYAAPLSCLSTFPSVDRMCRDLALIDSSENECQVIIDAYDNLSTYRGSSTLGFADRQVW